MLVIIAMLATNMPVLGLAARPESSQSTVRGRSPAGAKAFDIMPVRGVLKAGCSQRVEFAYYALPGQKAVANAVCEVVGGPCYTLPLTAESNAIRCIIRQHLATVLNVCCSLTSTCLCTLLMVLLP